MKLHWFPLWSLMVSFLILIHSLQTFIIKWRHAEIYSIPPPTFTFTFYSCGWLKSKTVSKILCTLGQWNLCQKRRGKKRSVRAQIIFHSTDLSIHVCIYVFLTESARKECSKKILLTLLKKYLLYCPKLVIIISWKWQVLLEFFKPCLLEKK